MNKNIKKLLLIGVLCTLQTACVVQQAPRPDDPYYAPVTMPAGPVSAPSSGSIYGNSRAVSLFEDNKARRIGDMITIVLSERTSSSKSSSITVDKDSKVGISGSTNGNTLLGTEPSFANMGLPTDISGTREFEGESDADQSNSLSGNITVTVVDVLHNGNLVVRGEKWITLNQGDEFIRISGIVRPQDVTADNRVQSMQLANARITYSGRGSFAESQQMGWLSRFFNSPVWPF